MKMRSCYLNMQNTVSPIPASCFGMYLCLMLARAGSCLENGSILHHLYLNFNWTRYWSCRDVCEHLCMRMYVWSEFQECVYEFYTLLWRQQELGVVFLWGSLVRFSLQGSDPHSYMSKTIFNFDSVMIFHLGFSPTMVPTHQIRLDFRCWCSTVMAKNGLWSETFISSI